MMERPRTPEAATGSLGLPPLTETFDFKYSASNGLLDLDDAPELCFDETPATAADTITTPGFFPLDAGLFIVQGQPESPSKPPKVDNSERAQCVIGLSANDALTTARDHEHIETTVVGTDRILWQGAKIFSDSTGIVPTMQNKTSGPNLILDSNRVDCKFVKGRSKDHVDERSFPKTRRSSAATISRLRSLIATASLDNRLEHHDEKTKPVFDNSRQPDQRSDANKVVEMQVNTASISLPQEGQICSAIETAVLVAANVNQVIDPANMNKTLVRMLPYDAIQRLQDKPELCISCTAIGSTTRCRNFTYWTDDAVERIAAEAAKIQVPYTIANAAPLLREVIGTATCTRGKHRKIAESQLEELEHVFSGNEERADSRWPSTKRMSPADMKAVPNWLAGLIQPFTAATTYRTAQSTSITAVTEAVLLEKVEDSIAVQARHDTQVITTSTTTLIQQSTDGAHSVPQPEHAGEMEPPATNPLPSTTTTTTTTTLVATSATIGQSFVHMPFPVWGRGLTTHQAIRDQLLLKLTPKEQGPGFIYMYWNPPNLGFVKIGVTQTNISRRLGQWRRQCGHEGQSHEVLGYEAEDDDDQNEDAATTDATTDATTKTRAELQIPHVYRVEHLVHTELREFRHIEQRCEKCGKKHIEWFGIDPRHARAVIRKWARWMKTRRPFEAPDTPDDNSSNPTPTPDTSQPKSKSKSKSKAKRAPSREARRIPFHPTTDAVYLPGQLTHEEIEEICTPLVPEPPRPLPVDRRKTRPRLSQTRATRTRTRRSTGDVQGVDLTFRVAGEGGSVEKTTSVESRVMQPVDEVDCESEGGCHITATKTAVVTEETVVERRIKTEDDKDEVQVSTSEIVTVTVDEVKVEVKEPEVC